MLFRVQGQKKENVSTAEGWDRVYDRCQRVSVLRISRCVVGFTANPTGGAGLVGGGTGFQGLEGSW